MVKLRCPNCGHDDNFRELSYVQLVSDIQSVSDDGTITYTGDSKVIYDSGELAEDPYVCGYCYHQFATLDDITAKGDSNG